MDIKRIQLQSHGDHRGMLIALEPERNVPFPIRRVKFLLDDGNGPTEVVLDDPSQGLLLGRMVWRELYDFSDDCVLMVLADQPYDPDDYITDYDLFLKEVHAELYPAGLVACLDR